MKNKIIIFITSLLSVFSLCVFRVYADVTVDLGMVKSNIGTVAFTFSEIGADYSVLVSDDGISWEAVAEVENNISAARREHNFTSRAVRYVKLETQSNAAASEVEVYRTDADGLNAAMVYPQPMSYNTLTDSGIKIEFGKNINSYYPDKAALTDSEGKQIKTENVLNSDGKSITLFPQTALLPGEYYTAAIKHFNKWGFGINSGAADGISGQMMSSLAMLPYGTISKSTDGDETTADEISIDDRGKMFEYDFGRVCNNITDFYISFKAVPVLIEIHASKDGLNWDLVYKHYTLGESRLTAAVNPVSARYVRICGVEGDMSIYEFKADTVVEKIPLGIALDKKGSDGEITLITTHEIKPETVGSKTVKLYKGNTLVPCIVAVSDDNKTVSISAKYGLESLEEYTVVIDGIKDSVGRTIKSTFNFTAEEQTTLEILTVSDSEYFSDRENAIYPVFADNLEYESWNENGRENGYKIKVSGGCKPYTFKLSGGSLPQGLSLDSDGRITGTAEKEGTAEFTVRVTDVKGNATEKVLSVTVNPYRSKWFADAKFGVMTQWGVFSMSDCGYTMTKTTADITAFENLIKDTFDAEEWAQQLEDMGAKVFNWTVMAGDSIRMFPSASPSAKGAKLTRNMAGELIDACHRHGIKFIGYIAPEFSWANTLSDYDTDTKSVSRLVVNTVEELLEMGMDGVWIDAGWVNSHVDWNSMLTAIRTINPYATLQSNASITKTGWIPMYPEVDIQTIECTNVDQTDGALHVGFKSAVEKKMAVEQTGLIGGSWGPSSRTGNLKSTDAVIKNIQDNWDNGVTYLMVFNASVEGDLVHPLHKESVKTITDWVKENISPCSAPVSNTDDKIIYDKPQSVVLTADSGSEIYYTTDGSIPNLDSEKYTGAIAVNETTVIKAAAYIDGKRKSSISEFTVCIDASDGSVNLFGSAPQTETKAVITPMMTGMFINTKNNPLVLSKIGKITGSGDSSGYTVIYEIGESYDVIFAEVLDFSQKSENGFAYADIKPVKLKAHTNYYILTKETKEYMQMSEMVRSSAKTDYIRIRNGVFSDCSMTKYYSDASYNQFDGQALDLVFDVMSASESSDNLALSADTRLLDNAGNERDASSWYYHSFNAVDGKSETYAAANSYAWTLWIDLEEIHTVSKIKLKFKDDLYSTSFAVYSSTDNSNWTEIYSKDDNSKTEFELNYIPFDTRYIMVRSFKPDAKGQTGGQMFISEVEVYK